MHPAPPPPFLHMVAVGAAHSEATRKRREIGVFIHDNAREDDMEFYGLVKLLRNVNVAQKSGTLFCDTIFFQWL